MKIMTDQERARLALTPLFMRLESDGMLDGELCETLVRNVMLVISDERFRCFQIAIDSEGCNDTAGEIAVSISTGGAG